MDHNASWKLWKGNLGTCFGQESALTFSGQNIWAGQSLTAMKILYNIIYIYYIYLLVQFYLWPWKLNPENEQNITAEAMEDSDYR